MGIFVLAPTSICGGETRAPTIFCVPERLRCIETLLLPRWLVQVLNSCDMKNIVISWELRGVLFSS